MSAMTIRVAIVGAGGFAREVLDVLDACNQAAPETWDCVGFVSEVESDWGRELNGKPCLGGLDALDGDTDVRLICGIGNPAVRHAVVARCSARGLQFTSVVHPHSTTTRWVQLGVGVVVTAGVVLTNNIRIGDHVHLNLHATVGHDAVIEDYVTVAPGVNVSGNVHVEAGCDLGTGSSIVQGLRIGEWTIVGAGAVVARDLPANCTAVGVPAKPIKERAPGWWRPS